MLAIPSGMPGTSRPTEGIPNTMRREDPTAAETGLKRKGGSGAGELISDPRPSPQPFASGTRPAGLAVRAAGVGWMDRQRPDEEI